MNFELLIIASGGVVAVLILDIIAYHSKSLSVKISNRIIASVSIFILYTVVVYYILNGYSLF